MIIEPCCVPKQLPNLADASFGRVMPFHTNGDVVLEDVLRAVSNLCGPSEVTLVLPEVNFRLAQVLKHGHERGWWTKFNILSAVNSAKLDEVPDVFEVVSLQITESSQMLIMEGEHGRIAFTGYFPLVSPSDSKKPFCMVNHAMLYQIPDAYDQNLWDEFVKIPTAKIRVAKRQLKAENQK